MVYSSCLKPYNLSRKITGVFPTLLPYLTSAVKHNKVIRLSCSYSFISTKVIRFFYQLLTVV